MWSEVFTVPEMELMASHSDGALLQLSVEQLCFSKEFCYVPVGKKKDLHISRNNCGPERGTTCFLTLHCVTVVTKWLGGLIAPSNLASSLSAVVTPAHCSAAGGKFALCLSFACFAHDHLLTRLLLALERSKNASCL